MRNSLPAEELIEQILAALRDYEGVAGEAPHPRDARMMELLFSLGAVGASERDCIAGKILQDVYLVGRLFRFANRAALLGALHQDRQFLEAACVAAAMRGYGADPRDSLVFIGFLWNAADAAGFDADDVFFRAAEETSSTGRQVLRDFAQRDRRNKDLGAWKLQTDSLVGEGARAWLEHPTDGLGRPWN